MKKYTFLLLSYCVLTLLASCNSSKPNLVFFQDLSEVEGILTTVDHTARIEPETRLVITVNSDIPEATSEFNQPYINPVPPGTTTSNNIPTLQQYVVDNKGCIDFPRLGTIHVAGMTTYDLKDYLTQRISEYVDKPYVNVSMEEYRIVVMGEVNEPQEILTKADRFSILDALAAAGDMTEYAMRDNVLILRRGDDNTISYHKLDLHDSNIVSSPYFWLKNNDVVLVSPNKIKEGNSKYNTNNAYKLSLVSTIAGVSTSIISLVIALTIR